MYTWANARAVAASAVRAMPPERRPLTEAIGQELAIATGAAVPEGTTSVLRSEDGEVVRGSGERGPEERTAGQRRDVLAARTARTTLTTRTALTPLGRDIRPRGQECRGLAACDALAVIPPEDAEAGTEVELLPRPGPVPLAGSTASSAAAAPARAVAV